MLTSHSLHWKDFTSKWYKRWARELLQDQEHRENFSLYSNKFWQNAAIVQALWERGALEKDNLGLGFGVGRERLPALFAKLGVQITATDQDYAGKSARHWTKYELSRSANQLNSLGICEPQQFERNVLFMPTDMKKISKKLYGRYNFLWSNCALGHLGSIEDGLAFIKKSLDCLLPGGVAVHTTELNILSDEETVQQGETVIFRLRDIHHLQKELIEAGYTVRPFHLTLGKTAWDRRISLAPQFGNDYSKIQYKGCLATQVVLIIKKPKHRNFVTKPLQKIKVGLCYRTNLRRLRSYRKADPMLNVLLANKGAEFEQVQVKPYQQKIQVHLERNKNKQIRLVYRNSSQVPLIGANTLLTAKPVALATTDPQDRSSKFLDTSWQSSNRPSTTLLAKYNSRRFEQRDYVLPGQDFAFDLVLGGDSVRKGRYREDFALVQELSGWIPNSTVTVEIEVA